MKFRLSIFLKLLIFILPLVSVPMLTVGYFSIQASVERVDRLVRREQMIQVTAAANRINDIFYYGRIDLETIASLPVLENYDTARSFRLNAEAEFNRNNIVRLFGEFIARTPFYYQIRYIDASGRELIAVRRDAAPTRLRDQAAQSYFMRARKAGPEEIFISKISIPDGHNGHLIHWVKPVFSGWREFAGAVVIDLDYDSILEIVHNVHIGEGGYAFLVDQKGHTIAHPQYGPYHRDLSNYADPGHKALVQEMITGLSDTKPYTVQGRQQVVAFSPVPIMKWSLAVTVPVEAFRKEAKAIQARVIQVTITTLILTVLCVSVLSYYLLRPVRTLVAAVNRVAGGDLSHKIPIHSHDELGDLTGAFNRMIKNLSRIQNELVRSEKLISLGRLSAGVAHEIRNPLNAMKGAIVYLKRKRHDDPLVSEYAHLIFEEIERLEHFVTDFLHFAKQPKPKPVATDLKQFLNSTQKLFARQGHTQQVRFHFRLHPEITSVALDPYQMEQVLVNVIINSLDALPGGGDITFSTFPATLKIDDGEIEAVRLEIRDNGSGITAADLANVFEPFFSTKEAGTGLGLPLSLGIVENHDGRMTLTPREGPGTRVTLLLPLKHTDTLRSPPAEPTFLKDSRENSIAPA